MDHAPYRFGDVLAAGWWRVTALRRPRLGGALLVGVPMVDLVLLAATVLDLGAGSTATFVHGLAAAYMLVAAIALIGDPARTLELQGWIQRLTMTLVI